MGISFPLGFSYIYGCSDEGDGKEGSEVPLVCR